MRRGWGSWGPIASPAPHLDSIVVQVVIDNGKRTMQQLSSSLHLSQHVVDSAHRLFMLAVEHNFIQGRKTLNVIASCLYIVCRREKSEHLLIDFADNMQVSLCLCVGVTTERAPFMTVSSYVLCVSV